MSRLQRKSPVRALPVSALLLGAGEGRRVGRPKAFLRHQGKTLVERAIDLVAPHCDEILVAVPKGRVRHARALIMNKSVRILTGGRTRAETIRILAEASTGQILLLHDIARPFAVAAQLKAVVQATRRAGAALSGLPLVMADGLAIAEGGKRVTGSLEKASVLSLQTPHAIRRSLLLRAFERFVKGQARSGHQDIETATLFLASGVCPVVVRGNPANVKITTRSDLGLLRSGRRRR